MSSLKNEFKLFTKIVYKSIEETMVSFGKIIVTSLQWFFKEKNLVFIVKFIRKFFDHRYTKVKIFRFFKKINNPWFYSVVYLVIALYFMSHEWPSKASEIGDMLAGLFAPLAFLWLVLGYRQQGEELKNSIEEYKNQVKIEKDKLKDTQKRRFADIDPRISFCPKYFGYDKDVGREVINMNVEALNAAAYDVRIYDIIFRDSQNDIFDTQTPLQPQIVFDSLIKVEKENDIQRLGWFSVCNENFSFTFKLNYKDTDNNDYVEHIIVKYVNDTHKIFTQRLERKLTPS